jgi:hypothetical protein
MALDEFKKALPVDSFSDIRTSFISGTKEEVMNRLEEARQKMFALRDEICSPILQVETSRYGLFKLCGKVHYLAGMVDAVASLGYISEEVRVRYLTESSRVFADACQRSVELDRSIFSDQRQRLKAVQIP